MIFMLYEEAEALRVETTFWQDFSIAEIFGLKAVQDTFERAFKEWRSDYRYLTELVMTLNHKCWAWYDKDDDLARLYNDLFFEADAWACDNLEGEELSFFYRVTD